MKPGSQGSNTGLNCTVLACTAWALLPFAAAAAGADWSRFRGPDGSGVATDAKTLPTTWTATENVLWKTPMPGAGTASPIAIGDKVFVSCYSGYGMSEDEPGDVNKLMLHLVCVNRGDGKILWQHDEKALQPEKEYTGFITMHGYAASTPTSDGQAVYAFWGHTGVFAFDMTGKPLWHTSVGEKTHGWGSAASPILCNDLLIVNASIESGRLVALDKSSGKQVWEYPDIKESWVTPAVVHLAGGKDELVISSKGKVFGLEPQSGKLLWQCDGVPDYICPSVLVHGDVVYITAGRTPMTLAVRAGGEGDVTKTCILWTIKKTPKVATPLYDQGLLYWMDHTGPAVCVKADNGDLVYEQRLTIPGKGEKMYASPVLGDGKWYAVSRHGGTFVFAAGPKFQQLAHNDLGDTSLCNATPAIVGNTLLLRSDRFLYCIGKSGK